MSEQAWLELAGRVSNFGTPTLLVVALITGYYQKWVWGHQLHEIRDRLTEMRLDRDFWRDHALSQTRVLEKTADRESRR